MSFHKDEIGYSLHNINAFTYADANARLNAVGLLPADIGKVAKQTDTNQYYILQSNSPVTWGSITGSGSGSSGINYVPDNNSSAADSVGDWHTYADAAGTAPVDGANAKGTGTLSSGSPVITGVPSTAGLVNGQTITGVGIPSNTTVLSFVVNTSITLSNNATANGAVSWSTFNLNNLTVTRSTVAPLRGTASFLITKDAANRQGQGVSFDMTIDSVDQSKTLAISFDYAPLGGFVAGSDTVNSDLLVYIYDITNNVVITAQPFKLTTGVGFTNTFNGSFQAASNSTSYRLILHVATTNAAAWTFKFDNVRVGPGTQVVNGVPVSDWVVFPMTISGSVSNPTKGTNSYDLAYWRRVGDSMEIVYTYIQTGAGAAGSGNYLFNIPTGYTIDTNKIRIASGQAQGAVGAAMVSSATQNLNGTVLVASSTQLALEAVNDTIAKFRLASGTTANLSDTGPVYSFRAVVPIVGWSANVVFSNDAGASGAVVALETAPIAATGTLSAVINTINFQNIVKDTHGAYSGGSYTVPVSGWYQVNAQIDVNGTYSVNNIVQIQVYLDAVQKAGNYTRVMVAVTNNFSVAVSDVIFCNAGQVITCKSLTNATGPTYSNSNTASSLSIHRVSAGPLSVAQQDTVAAAYSTAAGQSFTNGSTAVVNYGVKDYDTHGAVTPGANWFFTCPIAGKYLVNASIGFASNATGIREIYIRKNGVLTATNVTGVPGTDVGMVAVSYIVNCAAGDQISITGLQNSGGSLTLQISSGGLYNFVSIVRVGN